MKTATASVVPIKKSLNVIVRELYKQHKKDQQKTEAALVRKMRADPNIVLAELKGIAHQLVRDHIRSIRGDKIRSIKNYATKDSDHSLWTTKLMAKTDGELWFSMAMRNGKKLGECTRVEMKSMAEEYAEDGQNLLSRAGLCRAIADKMKKNTTLVEEELTNADLVELMKDLS